MIVTVLVVVFTHNLALGVFVGVLMSALTFARKISQIVRVTSLFDEKESRRTYLVQGQLFFVSAGAFAKSFDFREALKEVMIDVSHAHFWDITAINAVDKVVLKFRREGAHVTIVGMNEASATLVDRLAVHDKCGTMDRMLEH